MRGRQNKARCTACMPLSRRAIRIVVPVWLKHPLRPVFSQRVGGGRNALQFYASPFPSGEGSSRDPRHSSDMRRRSPPGTTLKMETAHMPRAPLGRALALPPGTAELRREPQAPPLGTSSTTQDSSLVRVYTFRSPRPVRLARADGLSVAAVASSDLQRTPAKQVRGDGRDRAGETTSCWVLLAALFHLPFTLLGPIC
jgi:hypothetical protein